MAVAIFATQSIHYAATFSTLTSLSKEQIHSVATRAKSHEHASCSSSLPRIPVKRGSSGAPNLALDCLARASGGSPQISLRKLQRERDVRIDAAVTAPAPAPTPADEAPEALPYPRSISEISNGDHILGFGADLGEDHPGFHDEAYKKRRSYIADLAKAHKIGEPLPHVEYTAEETRVWAEVLTRLSQLYPTHACREFLRTFPLFGFGPERVPQLEDLSLVLRDATGWQLRPVAGLLHPRDFLNGLAFKYFHSTQYIRHGSNPMYTPEPDVCHEVLGHVAMLADPNFAQLAQVIGLASLGATEKEIWHLTKLYWYTVEFGTVWEDGEVKAFGAGLLSSFGELEWMRSGGSPGGEADGRHVMPEFLPLDPFKKLPKMSYKDGFQKTYFLCSSFQDAAEKLRAYARSIHKANVSLHQ